MLSLRKHLPKAWLVLAVAARLSALVVETVPGRHLAISGAGLRVAQLAVVRALGTVFGKSKVGSGCTQDPPPFLKTTGAALRARRPSTECKYGAVDARAWQVVARCEAAKPPVVCCNSHARSTVPTRAGQHLSLAQLLASWPTRNSARSTSPLRQQAIGGADRFRYLFRQNALVRIARLAIG